MAEATWIRTVYQWEEFGGFWRRQYSNATDDLMRDISHWRSMDGLDGVFAGDPHGQVCLAWCWRTSDAGLRPTPLLITYERR